jgi:hypothetical protein
VDLATRSRRKKTGGGGTRRRSATLAAAGANSGTTEWDPDVQSQNQTWMYLFLTRELVASFPDSEQVRMEQLAWWNPAASPAVRRVDAQKKSIELHRFFRDAMKRPYETDFEQDGFAKAVLTLTDVLVVADHAVPDLATAIDSIFLFDDEG